MVKVDFAEIFDRLVSVLYPQRCLFCGDVVAYDDFYCGKCTANEKLPISFGGVSCDFPHGFADALAAIEYSGDARKLIWRLKDKADSRILRYLTSAMHGMMERHWSGLCIDFIVPVPCTRSRLKAQGFNHAEMLARYLSRYIKLPMQKDALIRLEATKVQHDLSSAERRLNADISYAIGKPDALSGKTILLVDDIFTTGATASACSDRLLESGAARVYVIAASGTPKPRV